VLFLVEKQSGFDFLHGTIRVPRLPKGVKMLASASGREIGVRDASQMPRQYPYNRGVASIVRVGFTANTRQANEIALAAPYREVGAFRANFEKTLH
jgi:hypothetical protein